MDEHMVQAASISGKSMSYVGVESSKQYVLAKGIQPNLSTVGHEAADGFIGNQVKGLLHTSYVYDSSINARAFGVNTTVRCALSHGGRSSFSRCLIEINANDMLKDTLTMGIPLIEDLSFSIEKRLALNMNGNHLVRKKVKSRSTNGGLFGGQLVKQNVRYEPKVASNVPKIGAFNVGNASKSGLSHVSFMSKNHPFKAIVPPASPRRSPNADEGVNIIVSNSYVALNDESEEEVENVYD
ncbi:hypothetical protein Tco_0840643 [Tanacetum coccineum]|uniref:Uncharacterized protein n=1 Tax=Tanacetum coccineum TaxID=301880 RepID=A0ABQ5AYI0_9ASTR